LTQPWYYVPLAVVVAPTLDANTWLAATGAARRIARIGLSVAVALAMIVPGWKQIPERRTNVDFVASFLAREAKAADMVVVYPFYYGVSFQRYYKGPAPWVTIPPIEDVHIHRYDLVKTAMTRSSLLDPTFERMAETLRSGHRIWLIGGLPPVPQGVRTEPLPPAPHLNSRWYLGPYLFNWGRQMTDLVQTHCLEADVVTVPHPGPVSVYEDLPITVLSGWH
jgi:hypothetical protein